MQDHQSLHETETDVVVLPVSTRSAASLQDDALHFGARCALLQATAHRDWQDVQAAASGHHHQQLTFVGRPAVPSSGSSPIMVNVFPLPVCPYAKMLELKPLKQFSTVGRPTTAQAQAQHSHHETSASKQQLLCAFHSQYRQHQESCST